MRIEEQLFGAFRALRFLDGPRFEWFGKRPAKLPTERAARLPEESLRSYWDGELARTLYTHFYRHGRARPIRWLEGGDHVMARADFIERLRRAAPFGHWQDPGWRVVSVAADRAILERGGLAVTAPLEQIAPGKDGLAPRRSVALHRATHLAAISPGFFTLAGAAPLTSGSGALLRLYWNVTARGAPVLLERLSGALNQRGAPFRLKAANAPAGYDRADSAVLYLPQAGFENLAGLLGGVYREIAPDLGRACPVFTLALAPGLGLAEDPPGHQSFGLHRSALMADGLRRAQEGRDTAPEARLAAVRASFEAAGLDWAAPHRNPGGTTDYPPLALPAMPRPPFRAATGSGPLPGARTEAVLHALADALSESAVVADGRATWIAPPSGNPLEGRFLALGADLYAGTPGVALFLAEYAARCARPPAADLARAALRQAVSRMGEVAPGLRASLFSGWGGLAVAMGRVALTLDDAALRAEAHEIGLAAAGHAALGDCPDLIGGDAGAILAMLHMAEITGDPRFVQAATEIGERLVRQARPGPDGVSWRTINGTRGYRLLGLSHGMAGIAAALFRLSLASGVARFADIARAAVAYEDSWFDPVQANWPDLRENRPRRQRGGGDRAFSMFWCHGGPGIALGRLAAAEAGVSEDALENARAALCATERALGASGTGCVEDLILCHGTLGLADILLTARRRGRPVASGVDRAASAGAETLLARLSGRGTDSFEITAALQPGLMTGLAGIGWFFLRLRHADIPSALNGFAPDGPAHSKAPAAPDP